MSTRSRQPRKSMKFATSHVSVDVHSESQMNTVSVNSCIAVPVDVCSESTGTE